MAELYKNTYYQKTRVQINKATEEISQKNIK